MMRGGARPGAGRKKMPIKRQPHSFRLFDTEYFLLKNAKKQLKTEPHLKSFLIRIKAILKKLKEKRYRLLKLILMIERLGH